MTPASSITTPNRRSGHIVRWLMVSFVLGLAALATADRASAVTPVDVGEQERIDLTPIGQLHEGRGDTFQLETAAGAEGVTGRMAVKSAVPGADPNWFVFALTNTSDRPVERWLTGERYTLIGSGVIWPDLDARRIEAVTPSLGYLPERIRSERADIFRITLEPGQTITYAVEMTPNRLARLFLWKPLEYELKARDRQLFNGTLLGIVGVLGVFLTAVFAANHKAIFPSAALVAWCVLGYLSVDFGFFHKLFNLRADDNAVYRAATEAALAASLVLFLHTFLRLGSWHAFIRMLMGVWIVAQLALVGLAVIDPRLAATFARVSFVVLGGLGALFTLFLALRGQDRALSLVPTWILLLVWIFGVGVALNGHLTGDLVVSGLVAGLVLLVVLIGFTVTQFAFRSQDGDYGVRPTEMHLSSLAIEGAGAGVWEWNPRRDEIKVGPAVEALLGLSAGELARKTDEFVKFMHPADREKFRLMLWALADKGSGTIRADFRLRHADNSYRWFDLDAASYPTSEQRSLRCVGLIRDVTDAKRAHERLMHDAVHDSITKLPNRELFLDRLANAKKRARSDKALRPTVLFIDIDRFKSVNASFGLVVGDSLLLTVARRIGKHLGLDDTLARVGGDQFAILITDPREPRELAMLAERIRRSLRAPIKIVGQDVVLTGSVGIAVDAAESDHDQDLLKEAEIAMYRAKREGSDRVEIFQPDMRGEADERHATEAELRTAIADKQLDVHYQPIVYMPTEELAGFEALVRWKHPRRGMVDPSEFVRIAEQSDMIGDLGRLVLERALADLAVWKRELPRPDRPLFVSVNLSSRQVFRTEIVNDLRQLLNAANIAPGTVRLEITESLAMENPEQAAETLNWLKATGADLALDDFGTGYSSLAYLQRFPVDVIKIDRSLVTDAVVDTAGAAIVRSIVALSHELGKKVVAEGVEDSEDAAFLRAIGCEFGQGFYFGEALPEREVVALLRSVRKTESKLRRRGFFRTKPAANSTVSAKKLERKKSAATAAARAAATEAEIANASEAELGIQPTDAAASGANGGPQPSPGGPRDTARPRGLSQLPASTIRTRRPPPVAPPPILPATGNGASPMAAGQGASASSRPNSGNGQQQSRTTPPTLPPTMPVSPPRLPPAQRQAPGQHAVAEAPGMPAAALTAALAGAVGDAPPAHMAPAATQIPPLPPSAPQAGPTPRTVPRSGPQTQPPVPAAGPSSGPAPGQPNGQAFPPGGPYLPPLPSGPPGRDRPAGPQPPSSPPSSLAALPPLTLPPLPSQPVRPAPAAAARTAALPPSIAQSLSRLAGDDGAGKK